MKIKALAIGLVFGCMFVFAGCEPNVNNGNDSVTDTFDTTQGEMMPETTLNTDVIDDNVIDEAAAVEGDSTAAFDEIKQLDTAPEEGTINLLLTPTQKICWGLGKACDEDNRPIDAINANDKYKDKNALFVGENEPKIYLTFDEGYENGYTAEILDTLKQKGVKATFFVTYDYCRSVPELVQRMIDEGHVVGNHSHTHPSFADCSDREVTEEIMFLHDYVKEEFDYTMNLVRFPKGEFTARSLDVASSLGYKSVFWSYAHVDWDVNNQLPVDETFEKVAAGTHPGEIALLHAVSKSNTEALPKIIDFWLEKGYELALF